MPSKDRADRSDNPANKKKYLLWVEDEIKAGLKFRKKYAYEMEWERLWRMFRSDWPELTGSHGEYDALLPMNYMWSLANVISASVFFRSPHIHVAPRIVPYTDREQMLRGTPPGALNNVEAGSSFEAEAVNEYRRRKAWVVESLDNWLAQEMQTKDTFSDLTYDPFLYGPGAVAVGFAPESLDQKLNYNNQ